MVIIVVISSLGKHAVRNEILACTIALHNSLNQILGHVLIVGKELLRVLRQTISAISERRIVILVADTRVEAYALDDGLCVEPLHLSVSIKLIEVAHTQCEVSIGEELHSLSLGKSHEERVNVLFQRTFLQQGGKRACSLVKAVGMVGQVGRRTSYDDATRVKIVVQSLALTKEFGREDKAKVSAILFIKSCAVTHGDGALYHHHGIGIHFSHEIDDLLHVRSVEVVLHRIIIGRRGYHYEVGIAVSVASVECSYEIELLLGKVFLNIVVLYGRNTIIDFFHLLGYNVHSLDLMVLGKKRGNAHAHITGASNSHLYLFEVIHVSRFYFTESKYTLFHPNRKSEMQKNKKILDFVILSLQIQIIFIPLHSLRIYIKQRKRKQEWNLSSRPTLTSSST